MSPIIYFRKSANHNINESDCLEGIIQSRIEKRMNDLSEQLLSIAHYLDHEKIAGKN